MSEFFPSFSCNVHTPELHFFLPASEESYVFNAYVLNEEQQTEEVIDYRVRAA